MGKNIMTVTTIDLYNVLKGKLGETEAKVFVEFVEEKVKDQLNQEMNTFATKGDIADLRENIRELDVRIEKVKADMIKWMFIFWVGQVSVTIALLLLLIKS